MFRIEPMTIDDIAAVGRVERRCFSNPWPSSAYRRELQMPDRNYYVLMRDHSIADGTEVADEPAGGETAEEASRRAIRRSLLPLGFGRRGDRRAQRRRANGLPPVVGFAGMWLMFDEAHITTIGVDPAYRGRHLGEWLLVALIDEALRRGANWLTLEVRVSNEAAQNLYRKYGFTVHGTRRRYYSDNNEDAYVMWSPALSDEAYQVRLNQLRAELGERLDLPSPLPASPVGATAAIGSAGPPIVE